MKMMKAVRYHGQRDIRLEDVEIVPCGRDQVMVDTSPKYPSASNSLLSVFYQVKPAFVGICGSGMMAGSTLVVEGV